MRQIRSYTEQNSAKINIRLGTVFDAPILAKFRYRFRASFAGAGDEKLEDETGFVPRCAEWMRRRLQQPSSWLCLLAEENGLVVGNLWLQLFEKIPNPSVSERETHAYLTNFYVIEECRGRGVGSMLLSAALDWCENEKADSIILWSTKGSRSLYLRHNFNVSQILMEYQL
jgi:GNAT superfamily N-acetyltransferase